MGKSFDLDKHLSEEHAVSPISAYLKEIVYGGADGIVTTFAVVAGFTGAQQNLSSNLPLLAILLFGFANLFADGLSMGLGNFLSLRSEQDRYRSEKEKELREIKQNPKQEREETIHILMKRGYSRQDAEELTSLYAKNEDYWAEFMMKYELEMPNPELENPYLTAIATIFAFIFFGFIPLIPYIFFKIGSQTFMISAIFTALALVLLGLLRWRVTRETVHRSVGEIVFVGGLAAVAAYIVGTFFRG